MKDSIWRRNPAKFVKECKRLRALAQRIIDGQETLIEGSLKMRHYRFAMKEGDNALWNIFNVVCSQSDHLPVGPTRLHWAPEALKAKDLEIDAIEKKYRDAVVKAARQIREDYAKYIIPERTQPSGALARMRNGSVEPAPSPYAYHGPVNHNDSTPREDEA